MKLDAQLRALAAAGQSWDYAGQARPMLFSERRALAEAVDAVAAARRQF